MDDKILFVDDDVMVLSGLKRQLRNQFHLKPCSATILRQAVKTGLKKYRKTARGHMQLNKVKESLVHAGEIQQTLIPVAAPVAEDFDLAGKTIWCDETGGIKETRNAKGEMFGKKRLKKIIRDHAQKPAKDIIDTVIQALEQFRSPIETEDDITLVVIKAL